ncbi:histidine kinase [Echinicola marina]|uniref:histidine kinase n=1 Tax=Echinicola marina TaxID=2859768 RepID=UPI001CF63471|nr:sensor histidine kinase [Echinicola marina]UCS95049.1 histidine kinase [Echinicola marina]
MIAESWRMIHFGLYGFGYWYFVSTIEAQIRLLKVEIQMLKNQLSPHFLLNTLTAIYGALSSKPNSFQPTIILQLATLLRYGLKYREGNVSLSKEIKHISRYLELQKFRYNDSQFVDLINDIPKYQAKVFQIPAMILVTLVDNMFQHGVINHLDAPGLIHFYTIQKKSSEGSYDYRLEFKNTIKSNRISKETLGIGTEYSKEILKYYYKDKVSFHKNTDADTSTFIFRINIRHDATNKENWNN